MGIGVNLNPKAKALGYTNQLRLRGLYLSLPSQATLAFGNPYGEREAATLRER